MKTSSPGSAHRAPLVPALRPDVQDRAPSGLRALRLALVSLAATATFAPPPARACHTLAQIADTFAAPATLAEVAYEHADFALGTRRGHYELLAPTFEWAPLSRLSFGLRVPVAHVSYSSGAMSSTGAALTSRASLGLRSAMALEAPSTAGTANGLGDLGVSVKVALLASAAWSVSLGFAAELPTGDEASGLGGGHVELAPYATFAFRATPRFSLYGLVTDRFAVLRDQPSMAMQMLKSRAHDMSGDGPHGSVLMPHSDHELAVRIGAAYTFERAWVGAGAEQTIVWSGQNGGLVLRAEAGALIARGLRLAIGYDAPVAGEQRFTWRGRLGAQWVF